MDPNEMMKLGSSLRRINSEFMAHQDGEELRVWYQGGEPYFGLMLDLDERHCPLWFQFTLRGRHLTWERRTRRVTTGHTDETDSRRTGRPTSAQLVDDRSTSHSFVLTAYGILATRFREEPVRKVLAVLRDTIQTVT